MYPALVGKVNEQQNWCSFGHLNEHLSNWQLTNVRYSLYPRELNVNIWTSRTLSWQLLPNGTQPTALAHTHTQSPVVSLTSITQKQSIPRFQSIHPSHLRLVNATNWSGPPAAPLIHSWRIWGLRGSHMALVWSMRKPCPFVLCV